MGDWHLDLKAAGTHSPSVPIDEQTAGWASIEGRSLVARLLESGHDVVEAFLTHWPGSEHAVRENLLTGEMTPAAPAATAQTAQSESVGEVSAEAAGGQTTSTVAGATADDGAEAPGS